MTTADDTARAILAAASLIDPRIREPDPAVIRAWAVVLGDIDRPAALNAVRDHYRTETRPLMPADVLRAPALGADPDRLPSAQPLRELLTGRPPLDPDRNRTHLGGIRRALTR